MTVLVLPVSSYCDSLHSPVTSNKPGGRRLRCADTHLMGDYFGMKCVEIALCGPYLHAELLHANT